MGGADGPGELREPAAGAYLGAYTPRLAWTRLGSTGALPSGY
jgi:hypothetical protein